MCRAVPHVSQSLDAALQIIIKFDRCCHAEALVITR
jgi:hypothetical protein